MKIKGVIEELKIKKNFEKIKNDSKNSKKYI